MLPHLARRGLIVDAAEIQIVPILKAGQRASKAVFVYISLYARLERTAVAIPVDLAVRFVDYLLWLAGQQAAVEDGP
jgi:hypothetical protein